MLYVRLIPERSNAKSAFCQEKQILQPKPPFNFHPHFPVTQSFNFQYKVPKVIEILSKNVNFLREHEKPVQYTDQ